MKRISTGTLTAIVAASLGLTAIAATSGSSYAQGNTATKARHSHSNVVAQAPAPATAAPAPVPFGSTDAPAAPAAQTAAPAPAPAAPAAAPAIPPPDFGNPPSGEIPILFNDHHVYTKPDRLTQNRVLAAIVRNNTILVPLRSMFEQMGATVSYNAATRTVDVNRPGSDVKVTVGKPEVLVNNESRPLDVAPEIYKGAVVVPLRVLSEGMGAYVQWVPQKRLVVVRYVAAAPPTPPPTPEPTAPPTPTPATPVPATAAPIVPVRAPTQYEHFVVGDYMYHPIVYNELSPGNRDNPGFGAKAAFEFPLFNLPWMLEGDYRSYKYGHYGTPIGTQAGGYTVTGACPTFPVYDDETCVNGIGNQSQVFVPTFVARDDDFDGRFGLKIADPRIYIGIGYIFRNSNYEGGAFPTQQHGLGGGIEKLPDLDEKFSLYFSMYYFANVTTNAMQNLGNGNFGNVAYRILKYAVGATFNLAGPLFIDIGVAGDKVTEKVNGWDATHFAPVVGLGINF